MEECSIVAYPCKTSKGENWYFHLHLHKGCNNLRVVEVTCSSAFSGPVNIVFQVLILQLYVIRIHVYIMTWWLCEMYPHDFPQTPIV
jgi:hypothetical protein